MNKKHVGFLHPGAMGISLSVTAQNLHGILFYASAMSQQKRGDFQEKWKKLLRHSKRRDFLAVSTSPHVKFTSASPSSKELIRRPL